MQIQQYQEISQLQSKLRECRKMQILKLHENVRTFHQTSGSLFAVVQFEKMNLDNVSGLSQTLLGMWALERFESSGGSMIITRVANPCVPKLWHPENLIASKY